MLIFSISFLYTYLFHHTSDPCHYSWWVMFSLLDALSLPLGHYSHLRHYKYFLYLSYLIQLSNIFILHPFFTHLSLFIIHMSVRTTFPWLIAFFSFFVVFILCSAPSSDSNPALVVLFNPHICRRFYCWCQLCGNTITAMSDIFLMISHLRHLSRFKHPAGGALYY